MYVKYRFIYIVYYFRSYHCPHFYPQVSASIRYCILCIYVLFFLGVYIYISICICIYVYIYIPPFVTHTHTHIFVYTDVPDTLSSFLDGHTTSAEASDSLVQAWVAHEAVYLALMGHFTKLIDYMAPWVENERLF